VKQTTSKATSARRTSQAKSGSIQTTKTNTISSAQKLVFVQIKGMYKWLKKERDAYPVIVFSLLPALMFWGSKNVTELTLGLMTRTLIASIFAGLFIYTVMYFVFKRDRFKASLFAILTIFVTFFYRYLYNFYRDDVVVRVFNPKSVLRSPDYFLPILFLGLIIIGLFIHRRLKFSKALRSYVTLLATALLLFNLFPIVRQYIGTWDLRNIEFGQPVVADSTKAKPAQPDIYYLVFDRYANQKVLKDTYGFDNSPFLDSLKEKGFYIAEDAAANYPATSFSLASSLNLDYLPDALKERSENGLFTTLLHNAVEENRVAPFLKDQGYTFLNIGPWWDTTKYSRHADENLVNPMGVVVLDQKIDMQEHERLLFQDTLFWQMSKNPRKIGDFVVHGRTYPDNDNTGRAIHKQTMEHQFKTLKEVARRPGPKYVFSHVLSPHDPYVVDEKCQHMPASKQHEYKLYIKQLKCANTNILQTVDHILKNNPTDPIIIIQADEGPYPIEFRKNLELDWTKAPTKLLHQKDKILSTYYFPDRDYSQLYHDISPVNTFRVIFNQYFGTELPLLPDRHFFSEKKSKRFHLFEVTDKFHSQD
jgi:hypothetical protein